jgi:hypothetical protein
MRVKEHSGTKDIRWALRSSGVPVMDGCFLDDLHLRILFWGYNFFKPSEVPNVNSLRVLSGVDWDALRNVP